MKKRPYLLKVYNKQGTIPAYSKVRFSDTHYSIKNTFKQLGFTEDA